MMNKIAPEVEPPDFLPSETKPQRFGGWFRWLQRRVKLAFAGDDEELLLENRTAVSWRVYHDYHLLGIIDADERQVFRLDKHGSLSVRPYTNEDEVEYLVLPLSVRVHRVHIYRRRLGKEVEVYDMRAA
jgi:hypothetical protein